MRSPSLMRGAGARARPREGGRARHAPVAPGNMRLPSVTSRPLKEPSVGQLMVKNHVNSTEGFAGSTVRQTRKRA
ncbi:hypothetical protein SGPA1_40129 [Streptomyces misionensis JCM 4497]